MLLTLFFLLGFARDGIEIHVFDVGQADSQLIVFPSGYSILVDAGETTSSSTNYKKIAQRVQEILGTTVVDVALITHLHADHMGYTNKNGGVCSDIEDIDWNIVGSSSSTPVNWVCYATNELSDTKIYKIRETAVICGNQITPPDSHASVEIVMSDAFNVSYNGMRLDDDYHNSTNPPSENDYSIALRIQYGDFVYSTNGDLDGKYQKSYSYTYHDIESHCMDRIGSVDLFHVNHHGSSHSNNEDFIGVLQPTVSVISCGEDNSYNHPTQTTLNTISEYSSKIYLTENCNSAVTDLFDNVVIVNGEIIISYTYGNDQFFVSNSTESFTTGFDVKKNKESRIECDKSDNGNLNGSSLVMWCLSMLLAIFFL
ncbi:Competence protein ComEC [Entamoeba marina]